MVVWRVGKDLEFWSPRTRVLAPCLSMCLLSDFGQVAPHLWAPVSSAVDKAGWTRWSLRALPTWIFCFGSRWILHNQAVAFFFHAAEVSWAAHLANSAWLWPGLLVWVGPQLLGPKVV